MSELTKKLGAFVRVREFGGVRNQFQLYFENGVMMQSYESPCVVRCGGETYLTDAHDFSRTTMKYVKQFTGLTADERRKGLESGAFIAVV